MINHPPWSGYDTGYMLVGAVVVFLTWAANGTQQAFAIGLCIALSYAAGRGVGAHR